MVKSPPYSFVLAWSPALDPPSSSPEDPFVLWSLRLIKSQLQPLWQPSHTSPSYSFLAKLHSSVTTAFVTCCLLLLSYCMYLQKVPWPPTQTPKWKFLICFLASLTLITLKLLCPVLKFPLCCIVFFCISQHHQTLNPPTYSSGCTSTTTLSQLGWPKEISHLDCSKSMRTASFLTGRTCSKYLGCHGKRESKILWRRKRMR